MGDLEQHYRNLGLSPSASFEKVQKAYRDLVMQCHPDLAPDNPRAKDQFLAIKESYKILREHLLQQPQAQEVSQPVGTYVNRDRPSTAEEFFAVAFVHQEDGNFQDAVESLNAAIRLRADWANAYFFRGHLCEKLGFENRAESDYREAARLRRQQEAPATSPPARHPEAPVAERSGEGSSLEAEFEQVRGNLRRPAPPRPPQQQYPPVERPPQVVHLPRKPQSASSRSASSGSRQSQDSDSRMKLMFALILGGLLGAFIIFIIMVVMSGQSRDETEASRNKVHLTQKTTIYLKLY